MTSFSVEVTRRTIEILVSRGDGIVYSQSVRLRPGDDLVAPLIESVSLALERTPPELCSDVVDRGITLLGAPELAELLRNELGLPVNPSSSC